ncbi:hypothetical protein R2601_04458 [Salipiger bermudensis HTCC2601]|uniref:Uncharacterized protein n=1 Tax=Salipiger bermudensis (strain DSM 26914 / JCM 13377 / KCTC 12554 / HTCC2601) TaxID=314265 RepID=Q0FVV4_SALBH|nr:hypothetical protein R2601_04458 [Salipiger bermudensis HTCC2601]
MSRARCRCRPRHAGRSSGCRCCSRSCRCPGSYRCHRRPRW